MSLITTFLKTLLASIGGIDAYTKLLLHCDGTNNSTTITDSSLSPHTMTAVGDAKITTANSKFGGAALTFDGTGDKVTSPSSADFSVGTGDFCVDFWLYVSSWATDVALFKIDTYGGMQIGRNGTTTKWGIASSAQSWNVEASTLPSTGAWHHMAVTRASGVVYLFEDGVLKTSAANTSNYPTGALVIGVSLNGQIDEVRLSKGVARWTANFTPPSMPYSAPA